jgi:hypothetical protein
MSPHLHLEGNLEI